MEKEKQKRQRCVHPKYWKTKIAVGLVAALLTANTAPAAAFSQPLQQSEQFLKETKATAPNASTSNISKIEQAETFYVSNANTEIELLAEEESGTTGKLTWKFKGNTLTISGSGEMGKYDWFVGAPWSENKMICSNLQYVIIENGATTIGEYAFAHCDQLISVQIPETVSQIGKYAFSYCSALETIKIPEKVTAIPDSTFLECTNLSRITLPDHLRCIEYHAFWGTGISSVVIPKTVDFLGLDSFPVETEMEFKKLEESENKVLKLTGSSSFLLTKNEHKQNYDSCASVVNSYLYEGENGTFYRVIHESGRVLIEQYQSNARFIKSWEVPMELSQFGGFYAGDDAFYIVFGQDNYKESDDVEVIRVVKYSKTMERLSSASLYGQNTQKPFEVSSLRMSEEGNYLYIYTGHQMYKSSGVNHQENMAMIVHTEAMICSYTPSTAGFSHISHSFNQFIATDKDKIVTVDHGDAGPRAIAMYIYSKDLATRKYVLLLPISGKSGSPTTGVSVGGLEVSDSSYLVADNTIDQSNYNRSKTRNVFLSVVDKNVVDETGYSPKRIQITDYEEGGMYTASTPQLVKISEDLFVVMWEESVKADYNGIVKAAFFNGEGEQLGDKKIYQFEGSLSDCQPILLNGKVTWFVALNDELYFYSFPAQVPGSAEIKVDKTTLNTPKRSIVLPAAAADKITQNTVTLNKAVVNPAESIYDGTLEYGWALKNNISQVKNWQSGTEFTGLQSGRTYYFFAKISGGTNYKNALSDALAVTTKSQNSEGSSSGSGGSGGSNSSSNNSGSSGSFGSGSGNSGSSGGSSGSSGSSGGSSSSSGSGSGSSGSSGGSSGSSSGGSSNSGSGSGSSSSSGGSSGSSGGGSSSSGSSGGSGGSSGGKGSSSSGSGGGGSSHSAASINSTSNGPGGSDTSFPSSLPSYVEMGEWITLNGTWHFVDTAGNMKVNTWTAAYNPYASAGQQNYDWFRFDAYGNMLTGWFLDYDGNWYFLNPISDGTQGRMLTGWVWVMDGFGVQRCYYFNPVSDGYRGKMMTNTIVDGYTIDASGCWTVNGIQQLK